LPTFRCLLSIARRIQPPLRDLAAEPEMARFHRSVARKMCSRTKHSILYEGTVQDGRAHVQGRPWNRAVTPESTGMCRRSAWSAFPPLCSDQSSAGAVLEAVYCRRPGLHSLPDNVISASSLSTFRQRLNTFLFQASFPDIIIDPR